MSLREAYPRTKLPDSHCFLTYSRGVRMRTIAFRPGLLYALLGLVPLLCVWYLGATVYLIFRDDMLGSLMKRQAEMQYAYEDRLAAMRGQLDRVTSRQLLDQDSFDGKVHELLSRQAQLETRGAIVANLTDQAGFGRDAFAARPMEARRMPLPAPRPAQTAAPVPMLSPNVSAFAPAQASAPPSPFDTIIAKPRLEESVRGADEPPVIRPLSRNDSPADLPASFLPVGSKLNRIASSLDRIEMQQIASLSAIEVKARAQAQQARSAIIEAGLREDRLVAPAKGGAQGGPFVPLKIDAAASPFERELSRLQTSLILADKFRRLMPYMPLRRPLPGALDVTSGFGLRVDPFIGRAAMHTGIDFRDDYGAGIRVTAAGKVISAGRTGGYGNMVEVDHGNGLTTRYGHLSQILVSEGQSVEAGAVIGKLGSTGRSTGPHLHYETRVDGEAVNPTRFLKAGERLFGG